MRRERNFKSKESNREFGNTQHISAILSISISPNIRSDVLSAIMGSHGKPWEHQGKPSTSMV
jgi:hypothetical protein